ASMVAVRPTSCTENVGGRSRRACAAPSTSACGALSPPIASSAMRITSDVLDLDSLLALVVAARRAHVVRTLQVPAPRTRLQRRPHGFVVRAPGPLLSLRRSALGYRHEHFLVSRGACP